jgi:transposase InsO family protein
MRSVFARIAVTFVKIHFVGALLAEWAYGRLYRTNDERLDALPAWVGSYNAERTHTALGGITPMEALRDNLHGNHI